MCSTVSDNVAMGVNWRGLETRSKIEMGAGMKTRSVRGSACMEIWEHMRRDELWRRKYGQLDTQTRNVSNQ